MYAITKTREICNGKMRKPGEEYMPGRGQKNGHSVPMSGIQSGTKIAIDVRECNTMQIEEFVKGHPHLRMGDDSIGIFKEIIPTKMRGKQINIDTGRKLLSWEPEKNSSDNVGYLTFVEQGLEKRVKSYQKCMPLIDPIVWMEEKERPNQPFFWNTQHADVISPENQGYVDCVASFMVSKLRKQLKSPHFCDFYGCLRAIIDVYLFNLEDDFEEFRFTKWFWAAVDAKEFGLRVVEKNSGRRLTLDEIKEMSKPDDEFLHDDSDSDSEDAKSTNSKLSSVSAISLDNILNANNILINNLEEVDVSFSDNTEVIQICKRNSSTPKTVKSMSTSSDDTNMSFSDEYEIYAELNDMPVAIQYIEYCEGTMDTLLEDSVYAPIKTAEQEIKWAAWLFQVCVALSQLQNILNLTHNDLHTCNVLWRKTAQEYLYYHDSKDRRWKVPTYGYVFSIIDYGRAIFSLNNFFIISSDYNEGHNAWGMYNFGPILNDSMQKIVPNKSFDLSRLSCSLLRGLFLENPPAQGPKSQLLTKDGSWEVRETAHPVFNSLWSWLKTKKGENILERENGSEKYPGFDLYIVIAKDVADAIPENQFSKASMFKPFLHKSEKDVNVPFWIQLPI